LAARYRGSILGFLWSFLNPVLLLLVYTFVFSSLVVFTLFTEPILRSPTLIVANPNYVKKVVSPLEILPCVALGTSPPSTPS
jgi:lipopolysaccharide transport system permease protein